MQAGLWGLGRETVGGGEDGERDEHGCDIEGGGPPSLDRRRWSWCDRCRGEIRALRSVGGGEMGGDRIVVGAMEGTGG